MRRRYAAWIATALLASGCSSPGERSGATIWSRAAGFVEVQSSVQYLTSEDPVFLSLEGDPTPTGWVDYFFSMASTRNWINESDEYAEYEDPRLVLPDGIVLLPEHVDRGSDVPQLVVTADDERGVIRVEGYDVPATAAVFSAEWAFPELD